MRNNDRVMRLAGDPSSKYGLNPDQFEIDIESRRKTADETYEDFKKFMVSHNMDIKSYRLLFMKYYEEFLK